MSTYGPYYPSSGVSTNSYSYGVIGSGQVWSNPGNCGEDDGEITAVNFTDVPFFSECLYASDFNMAIPLGYQIDSITVRVGDMVTIFGSGVEDRVVQLVKGSTELGVNKAGIAALWNTTRDYTDFEWEEANAADMNASDFGVIIACNCAVGSGVASFDYVSITVEAQFVDLVIIEKKSPFLCFRNVPVPHDVVITRSFITLVANETLTENNVNAIIYGDDSDTAIAVTSSEDGNEKPLTDAYVNWTDINDFTIEDVIETPDISEIIQEITDRDGWSYGNDLQILIHENESDNDCLRSFYDYSEDPDKAAKLTVYYKILQSGSGGVKCGGLSPISLISNNGNGLYANNAYLTFRNIAIPKRATINAAIIRFTAKDSGSGSGFPPNEQHFVKAMISGQAADTGTAPTTAEEAYALDRTESCQNWDDVESWETDEEYDSPNIACVIQEIVDRTGWTSGNDITIFIEDYNSGSSGSTGLAQTRSSYDFSEDPEKCPQFLIYYALVDVGSGGVVCGGTAPNSTSASITYNEIGSGGVVCGSTALIRIRTSKIATGGVIVAGISLEEIVKSGVVSTGGIVVAGTLSNTVIANVISIGGIRVGGTSTYNKFQTIDSTGGNVVGGSAIVSSFITTYGGAVAAGTSDTLKINNYTATGGNIVGANSIYNVITLRQASGGVALRGTALVNASIVGRGGTIVAGSAIVSEKFRFIAAGGSVVGSSALYSIITNKASTGGCTISGTANCFVVRTLETSGGVNVSGLSKFFTLFTKIATGGMVIGGINTYRYSSNISALGGVVIAGTIVNRIRAQGTSTGGVRVGGKGRIERIKYRPPSYRGGVGETIIGNPLAIDIATPDKLFRPTRLIVPDTQQINPREDLVGVWCHVEDRCEEGVLPNIIVIRQKGYVPDPKGTTIPRSRGITQVT